MKHFIAGKWTFVDGTTKYNIMDIYTDTSSFRVSYRKHFLQLLLIVATGNGTIYLGILHVIKQTMTSSTLSTMLGETWHKLSKSQQSIYF